MEAAPLGAVFGSKTNLTHSCLPGFSLEEATRSQAGISSHHLVPPQKELAFVHFGSWALLCPASAGFMPASSTQGEEGGRLGSPGKMVCFFDVLLGCMRSAEGKRELREETTAAKRRNHGGGEAVSSVAELRRWSLFYFL